MYLLIEKVKVCRANCISGLTYGFPSITNFLGFTHALARLLKSNHLSSYIALKGCAVVCHNYRLHCQETVNYKQKILTQTRNPLTKDSKTQPFQMEGKIDFEVSLLIECESNLVNLVNSKLVEADTNSLKNFESQIKDLLYKLRIAGGNIEDIRDLSFVVNPNSRDYLRKILPGFFLVHRDDIMNKISYENCNNNSVDTSTFFKWLNLFSIEYSSGIKSTNNSNKQEYNWHVVEKEFNQGWLVPIQIGFAPISELLNAGSVPSSRCRKTPFRFVEAIYSVGEWVSPHHIQRISDVMWHYDYLDTDCVDNLYLAVNNYGTNKGEDNE
jgi:CRISPR-associated protein Csy2